LNRIEPVRIEPVRIEPVRIELAAIPNAVRQLFWRTNSGTPSN
jgi:hypothetical protein